MNALAANRERLFAALEQFVNLGDSLPDLEKFREQWPDFFPPHVYDKTLESAQEGRFVSISGDSTRPITFAEYIDVDEPNVTHFLCGYRNWLRQIWRDSESAQPEWLFWMLGVVRDNSSPFSEVGEYMPLADSQLNWKTGHLEYKHSFEFQAALYALFTSSWRAKMCARCSRYFIAAKSAQRYCDPKCYQEVKRERGNEWWKREGRARRKSRPTPKRRTAQKRISRRK